jgi:antitoxin component YwqK of YwqJK toxin-antitoxin module
LSSEIIGCANIKNILNKNNYIYDTTVQTLNMNVNNYLNFDSIVHMESKSEEKNVKYYDKNGELKMEKNFVNNNLILKRNYFYNDFGILVENEIYYDSGEIYYVQSYLNGVAVGKKKIYYKNGFLWKQINHIRDTNNELSLSNVIFEEIPFINNYMVNCIDDSKLIVDKKELCVEYYENGRLKTCIEMTDSTKGEVHNYDEKGLLINFYEFKKGLLSKNQIELVFNQVSNCEYVSQYIFSKFEFLNCYFFNGYYKNYDKMGKEINTYLYCNGLKIQN